LNYVLTKAFHKVLTDRYFILDKYIVK